MRRQRARGRHVSTRHGILKQTRFVGNTGLRTACLRTHQLRSGAESTSGVWRDARKYFASILPPASLLSKRASTLLMKAKAEIFHGCRDEKRIFLQYHDFLLSQFEEGVGELINPLFDCGGRMTAAAFFVKLALVYARLRASVIAPRPEVHRHTRARSTSGDSSAPGPGPVSTSRRTQALPPPRGF